MKIFILTINEAYERPQKLGIFTSFESAKEYATSIWLNLNGKGGDPIFEQQEVAKRISHLTPQSLWATNQNQPCGLIGNEWLQIEEFAVGCKHAISFARSFSEEG